MTTPISRFDRVNCPHCGDENDASATTCGSCSRGLTVYIGPAHNLPRRFGLGPLMILVAVFAIGLGVLREMPGLGVAMLILLPPAVVRTAAFVTQRAEDGRPMLAGDKAYTFIASIGIMMVVILSGVSCFGLVCIPLGMMGTIGGGSGMILAASVAGGIALYVAYRVLRRLWPYKE